MTLVAADELFEAMRATIRAHLENPFNLKWTVQGFGMMRCYFEADKRFRLNIWDPRLAVPGVSVVHNHPWHFTSWIINGAFRNIRYMKDERRGVAWNYMVIKTGEGGGPMYDNDKGVMRLLEREPEVYTAGHTYSQRANEVHRSDYDPGTVTINDRERVGDGEHALVFWPYQEEWVDAEPRAATWFEIADVTKRALAKWEDR
jgi:hypothetical protein